MDTYYIKISCACVHFFLLFWGFEVLTIKPLGKHKSKVFNSDKITNSSDLQQTMISLWSFILTFELLIWQLPYLCLCILHNQLLSSFFEQYTVGQEIPWILNFHNEVDYTVQIKLFIYLFKWQVEVLLFFADTNNIWEIMTTKPCNYWAVNPIEMIFCYWPYNCEDQIVPIIL